MRRRFKVILALVLLISVFPVTKLSNTNTISAQAETTRHLSDKAWTKKLANAGYVFELPDATKGALYKNTAAKGGKSYSKKVLKKLVKNHTLFKVKKLSTVKNGISVDLVSKDGKYKGYTNYINGIYNKNLLNKKLQPLINLELKAIDEKDKKVAKADVAKVSKLAKQLTGKNKKVANTSINQLKQFLKNKDLSETPVLLIGKYPGNILE
ncbi:hypothetical protein OZX56_02895 [Lactobacillus sp. ESL0684]|uniref:hypothetical protein n=1 Tax=Lactobacillus sp. ESL0684 TaxID=2983213 RepID=UPI0023F974BF|nr:hypothetical protein [Lactobacillus sp. ESL0684]WEV44192.1 hypothetical protein OZX56_02895 [Lactobacillus sp. ESL0684]